VTSGLRHPVRLAPHFVERFYRASGSMAAFRGAPGGEYDSEEWIASTTAVFGGAPGEGLTRLDDGQALRDRIEADPVAALGPEHVARFGSSTELLLKILDAGQRLPVHAHPDRGFAHAHLASAHGKTEAWVILDAPEGAVVHVGFREPIETDRLLALMERQDAARMLALLHELPVRAGDTVLVPAGLPHAIGAGILLAELQEPSDFSMMIEWAGYALDAAATGRLGLPLAEAVGAIDTAGVPRDRVEALRGRFDEHAAAGASVLTPLADPYFRAEAMRGGADLDPGFGVALVVDGSLTLAPAEGEPFRMERGETVLLPHAAGTVRVGGTGHGLRFRPPAPGASTLPAG
jgi:mannose-6-phosphate isomerase